MILFVLWTLLLAPLVVAAVSQDSCYADETDPYTMFATATPYKTWLEESVDPVLAAERKYSSPSLHACPRLKRHSVFIIVDYTAAIQN
jgi:hypothetical protein